MGYRSQTPHRALASLGPRAPSRSWPKPTRAQARSLLPSFSCSPRRLAAQPRPSVGWSLPPVATATRGDPPAAADHHPHTLLVYRRPSAGPSRRSLPQPAARRDPLAVAIITLSGSTAVPYVAVLPLAGLDTLTPTLIVGNGLKMIGEYEETVGTCYLFSESEAQPKPASNETRPSEENTDKPTSCSKEALSKEVNHLASVQKILKFRPVNAERPQHLAYQHKDKEI
ncbi:hypothetical protein SORBI_3006G156801 [Sorghum bicolor]|uniref:Transcription factor TFIIIC triple barrel domain-containing protein n=1 Tax=Sorghum bicolor TaxID=4558 RepID=A0A1B6PM05_SORBI|nr:hypothetical protein SORBI_3006G156801 [Sorghum bicolor]